MAKDLHKKLISYFSQLHKCEEKFAEFSDTAKRPLNALKNQSEQLRAVKREENNNTELFQVPELRERLIFKILMGVEFEVTAILEILNLFNNMIQDLKNKLKNLERSRSKISLDDPSMVELVKGTAYRPTLNHLLEWARWGLNYYTNLYSYVDSCLKNLNYEDEGLVDDLKKSFKEDRKQRKKLNRILAFTTFLIKEKVN